MKIELKAIERYLERNPEDKVDAEKVYWYIRLKRRSVNLVFVSLLSIAFLGVVSLVSRHWAWEDRLPFFVFGAIVMTVSVVSHFFVGEQLRDHSNLEEVSTEIERAIRDFVDLFKRSELLTSTAYHVTDELESTAGTMILGIFCNKYEESVVLPRYQRMYAVASHFFSLESLEAILDRAAYNISLSDRMTPSQRDKFLAKAAMIITRRKSFRH